MANLPHDTGDARPMSARVARPRRTVHDLPTGVPFVLQPGGTAYRRVFSPDGRTWLRSVEGDRLVLCVLPFPVYPVDPEPIEEVDSD